MFLQTFFKDARYFQILFQSIFLFYAVFFLHWNNQGWLFATFFISAIATQLLCEYFLGNKEKRFLQRIKNGFPSILISAFGLSLLLKTNIWWVAVFAAVIAIASKYIIHVNGKHIFNPSALGIVAAILFTDKAWINSGQWGSGIVLLFGVCCLGFIIVTKVQKLAVSLSFLGVFAVLFFMRQVIYLGWPIDFFIQSISTGSMLLFSFFMITDPRTTPNHHWVRMVWCIAIAAVSFYFTAFKFINGAPIFALVGAQLFIPLLNYFFKEESFEWLSIKHNSFKKNYSIQPFLQNQSTN